MSGLLDGQCSQALFSLTQQILKLDATRVSALVVTTFAQGLGDDWWGPVRFCLYPNMLIITEVVIVGCGLLIFFSRGVLSRKAALG